MFDSDFTTTVQSFLLGIPDKEVDLSAVSAMQPMKKSKVHAQLINTKQKLHIHKYPSLRKRETLDSVGLRR